MRSEGETIPAFELPSDDGTTFRFPTGKPTVVYFYPRDNTPGCTREAIEFTGLAKAFQKLGVTVCGVSKDSIKSHCGFRDKHALSIKLLADEDLAVHRSFGAFGEKTMYGKKVEGTIRSTFLLDGKGVVLRAWPSVKVDGHAEAVLRAASGEDAATQKKTAAAKYPAAVKKPVVAAKKPAAKKPAVAKKPTAEKPAAKATPAKPARKKPA